MSRTNNAIKAIASNIMLQLTIAICGFILPPLLIANYGSEVNGLITTIRQLITYFSVVTLGLSTAGAAALYSPLSKNDTTTINRTLSALKGFYNKTGIVFVFLITIAAFIFPMIQSAEGVTATDIALLVFICGIGSSVEYIITAKYKVLLTADQKIYVLARIQTEGTILNTLCSAILIYFNASILLIQTVATLVYVIRMLMTVTYVKKQYRYIDVNVEPDYSLINNRWSALSYQASSMIISYTPVILVAVLLNYASVSVFTVYNLVFSSIAMIVGIFSSGLAAVFGNVIAQNETELLKKRFATYEFIFEIILYVVYTCAMILILPFVSVYIQANDGTNYIVPLLGIGCALNGLFKSIRVPYTTLVEASGTFKENNIANILEAIFIVVVSAVGIKLIGVAGAVLGAAIIALIRSSMYQNFICKHVLNVGMLKYIVKNGFNIAAMISIYNVFGTITVSNYFDWFLNAILVFAVTIVVYLFLNIIMDRKCALDTLLYCKNFIFSKIKK